MSRAPHRSSGGTWATSGTVAHAIRDRSYQDCPLGLVVADYLRWKQMEQGRADTTLRDYEIPLAYLCLDYPMLELKAFEPPAGRKLIREFLDRHWGSGAPAHPRTKTGAGKRAPRTRKKNRDILSDFFKYCVVEDLITGSPTVGIAASSDVQKRRDVYAVGEPERILQACDFDRERCAVALLWEYGLRKSELRLLRLKDYDVHRRTLTVTGKRGKTRYLPVEDPELVQILDAHWALRLAEGSTDEYLLYPYKVGPKHQADGPRLEVLWEDRRKPMSDSMAHRWWKRRLAAAGVSQERTMHEMRHTAATDLLRSGAGIEIVRDMLGHADIQTTQVYTHMVQSDLSRALARKHHGGTATA